MSLRRFALLSALILPLGAQSPGPAAALARLQAQALASEEGYRKLAWLCDRVGHRLSGSPQPEEAIRWALETLKAEGFRNVHGEKVRVPRWVRGREQGEILSPTAHRLHVLGLGGTEPTPPGGLEAEVVVVGSYEELRALPADRVRGRVVCYDVPYKGYGATVGYRVNGAVEAARLGAVGVLLRSVGPASLDTPHTGSMRYEVGVPRIPAAAIPIEAATQLRRMQERGERIRVRLELENRVLEDAESANVVAEVPGRERPEEIVLLSGHLDSWDVGQGAQDDGVGSLMAWEAARLIQASGLRPRRTIRVVLFTNEENGLRGGHAYRDAHRDELPRHVAMVEADSGNGPIQGFNLDLNSGPGRGGRARSGEGSPADPEVQAAALAWLRQFSPLLAPFGAGKIESGGSGADLEPSVALGVPGIGVNQDTTEYFKIHHTWADTFDKVDKAAFQKNVAALAALAYLLAEAPDRIPLGAELVAK